MIRATLTPLEVRLCGPRYLDVRAFEAQRVIGGREAMDLGEAVAIIVGEAPGPRTSKSCPVFPYPPTSAGGRLLAISGMPAEEYLRRFARRNLLDACPTAWRKAERIAAQDRAVAIVGEAGERARFVLLGANVLRAFRPFFGGDDPEPCRELDLAQSHAFLALPHPSGRNAFYNAMSNRATAGDMLRRFASAPLPPCPACTTSPAETWTYPWEGACHCGAWLRYERGIDGASVEVTHSIGGQQ